MPPQKTKDVDIMAKYLVIDNGGTFVKPAIMDGDGNILEMLPKVPTNSLKTDAVFTEGNGPQMGALDSVEKYLELLDGIYAPLKGQVDGIAMSFPGVNDAEKGYCYSGGAFLFAAGQPLGPIMQEHFGIPCTLENDGKCAALAEYWKGSLQDVQNGAVIVLGTGVGGGVIVNGELVRGRRFSAGEMSFLLNDLQKPFESGSYFGSCGAAALCAGVAYATGTPMEEVDGFKAFELIRSGHPGAKAVFDKLVQTIAGQAYNLTTVLDLDAVAIGGGISREQMLIDAIQAAVEKLNESHPLAPYSAFYPHPVVRACQFHNEANMVGALYHHLKLLGKLG